MAEESLRLPTRVGHAQWGDNRFFGQSVRDDLAGTSGIWDLVALAVGHAKLGDRERAILEDLSTASLAADPRIWAMKVVRLASAWGQLAPGICAGLLATEGVYGPGSVRPCAELLLQLAAELGDGDDAALDAIVARVLAAPEARIPGFGVPAREQDERVTTVARCLERRGLEHLPHWSLVRRLETVMSKRRKSPLNIGGAYAALLLDCGFTPAQVQPVVLFCVLPNLLANAQEGAVQAPAVLQRLPASTVRYVGAPPRKSPRAPRSP